MMKGRPLPAGAPQAMGETPMSFDLPPHTGSAGDELVKTKLIMPASTACCTSHADMPKWFEFLTDTMPIPGIASAMLIAASIAKCAARNPKPLCPSTWPWTGYVPGRVPVIMLDLMPGNVFIKSGSNLVPCPMNLAMS